MRLGPQQGPSSVPEPQWGGAGLSEQHSGRFLMQTFPHNALRWTQPTREADGSPLGALGPRPLLLPSLHFPCHPSPLHGAQKSFLQHKPHTCPHLQPWQGDSSVSSELGEPSQGRHLMPPGRRRKRWQGPGLGQAAGGELWGLRCPSRRDGLRVGDTPWLAWRRLDKGAWVSL